MTPNNPCCEPARHRSLDCRFNQAALQRSIERRCREPVRQLIPNFLPPLVVPTNPEELEVCSHSDACCESCAATRILKKVGDAVFSKRMTLSAYVSPVFAGVGRLNLQISTLNVVFFGVNVQLSKVF